MLSTISRDVVIRLTFNLTKVCNYLDFMAYIRNYIISDTTSEFHIKLLV